MQTITATQSLTVADLEMLRQIKKTASIDE